MKILAIESSCDETAAAVVENGTVVLGNSIASSAAMHAKYGGIVPEIAAREQLRCIMPVIHETLDQSHETLNSINAIAVTVGPGLIGSLLVGVETAKSLCLAKNKPLIPVNHVLAHMYANFIGDNTVTFPAISLVVSGGHTELFLMKSQHQVTWLGGTLDDAAGEAFDKAARLLGFENRGGPAIQEAAGKSDRTKDRNPFALPRPMLDKKNIMNFSFSGLKTAILRTVETLNKSGGLNDTAINQLANEVQESITDVLVKKTLNTAIAYDAQSVLLSGGVASNLRLREKFLEQLSGQHIALHVPPVSLCTDNAVYIGCYAYFKGEPIDWRSVTAIPDLSVEV